MSKASKTTTQSDILPSGGASLPSQMSRRKLIVNSIVSVASLASASAVSITPASSTAYGMDRSAIVARAEEMIKTLSGSHVRQGFSLDQEAAASMLRYCQFGDFNGDDPGFEAVLKFCSDYNQSLDWLFCGDVGSYIAKAAAEAEPAEVATNEQRIFELEAKLHTAWTKLGEVCDVVAASDEIMFAWTRRNPKPKMRDFTVPTVKWDSKEPLVFGSEAYKAYMLATDDANLGPQGGDG